MLLNEMRRPNEERHCDQIIRKQRKAFKRQAHTNAHAYWKFNVQLKKRFQYSIYAFELILVDFTFTRPYNSAFSLQIECHTRDYGEQAPHTAFITSQYWMKLSINLDIIHVPQWTWINIKRSASARTHTHIDNVSLLLLTFQKRHCLCNDVMALARVGL